MTISIVQTSPYSGTPHQEHAAGTAMSNPTALGAITQNDLVIGAGYNTGISALFTPGGSYTADINYDGTNAIGGLTVQSKIAGASESTTLTTTSSSSGPWAFSALEASGIQTSSPLLSATTAQLTSNNTQLTITSPSITAGLYVDVLAILVLFLGTTPGTGDGNIDNLTGWTHVYDAASGVAFAYQIFTAPSGTISVTGQWSASTVAQAGLAIYKGLAAASYPGEFFAL